MKINVKFDRPVTKKFEVPAEYEKYVKYLFDHSDAEPWDERYELTMDKINDLIELLDSELATVDNLKVSYNGNVILGE